MERSLIRAGVLCLVAASCSLEHPISRNLDVNCPCDDSAAPDVVLPDVPTPLDTPDVADAGERPDVIDAGDTPDVIAPMDAVDAGDVRDAPDVIAPDVFDAPEVFDTPDVIPPMDRPDVPPPMDTPDVPDVPPPMDTPDVPDVPPPRDVPDVPDVPVDSGPPVYESCEDVRVRQRPSGAYLIRAGSMTPWLAFCDTSDAMGAWTLVLKANGLLRTFAYESPLWTNAELLAPQSANLDRVEAKFLGFLSLPVSALRLQFVTPADAPMGTVRTLVVAGLSGAPLQRSFLDDAFIDLAPRTTENDLLNLVPGSSVQMLCRRRGFNVRSDTPANARVRIGMNGNEDAAAAACRSHDSWVGVGGAGSTCGALDVTTVGNVGCNNGPGGARNIPSFAYVWVR